MSDPINKGETTHQQVLETEQELFVDLGKDFQTARAKITGVRDVLLDSQDDTKSVQDLKAELEAKLSEVSEALETIHGRHIQVISMFNQRLGCMLAENQHLVGKLTSTQAQLQSTANDQEPLAKTEEDVVKTGSTQQAIQGTEQQTLQASLRAAQVFGLSSNEMSACGRTNVTSGATLSAGKQNGLGMPKWAYHKVMVAELVGRADKILMERINNRLDGLGYPRIKGTVSLVNGYALATTTPTAYRQSLETVVAQVLEPFNTHFKYIKEEWALAKRWYNHREAWRHPSKYAVEGYLDISKLKQLQKDIMEKSEFEPVRKAASVMVEVLLQEEYRIIRVRTRGAYLAST